MKYSTWNNTHSFFDSSVKSEPESRSLLTWALNWSLWGRITCRPIHVFARILHYLFYMAPSIGKPALAHWHRAPHPSTAPHLLFSISSTSFAPKLAFIVAILHLHFYFIFEGWNLKDRFPLLGKYLCDIGELTTFSNSVLISAML